MSDAGSSPFSKARTEALSDGVFAIALVFIEPPRAFLVFALVQVLGQVIARRLSGRLRDRRAGTVVASLPTTSTISSCS